MTDFRAEADVIFASLLARIGEANPQPRLNPGISAARINGDSGIDGSAGWRAAVRQHRDLVRYAVIHELCHTVHMDHSKEFWRLVAAHEPSYKILDRALREAWKSVPQWVF